MDSRARQAHRLRAARGAVRDAEGSRDHPAGARRKEHGNGAIGARRNRAATGVGNGKIAGIGPRECQAGNAQGGAARIGQGGGLCRTGDIYRLIAEGQALGGEGDCSRGGGAGSGETHGLGAARGAVRDAEGCREGSYRAWRKGHVDRAVGFCRHGVPARIGLGKGARVGAREREAGNTQSGAARVGQGEGLSRAGGADGLARESEAGGGKTGGGRSARSGEFYTLAAVGGPVGEGDVGSKRSRRGGRKRYADRTTRSCRDDRATVIGLRKVAGISAGERDAGNAQSRAARVGEGNRMSCTARADGLIPKGEAGGGKAGNGRRFFPIVAYGLGSGSPPRAGCGQYGHGDQECGENHCRAAVGSKLFRVHWRSLHFSHPVKLLVLPMNVYSTGVLSLEVFFL